MLKEPLPKENDTEESSDLACPPSRRASRALEGKLRIVSCAEDHASHIGLPRGCLTDLQQLISQLNVSVAVRDERCSGTSLDVTFHGELRTRTAKGP